MDIKETIDKYLDKLVYAYGWRGFLLRMVIVFIFWQIFKYSAITGGSAGGKLYLFPIGLFVYSIFKLAFDYSKIGKDKQTENQWGQTPLILKK